MTKTRDDQADRTAELSEAARAAVRDPGDPRIDAHLAALGLAPDSAPPARRPAAAAAAAAPSDAELVEVRDRIAGLEASLSGARSRMRVLAVALAVALVSDAILVLLLVRPG